MGKRDVVTKSYMSKPHYFADAFNVAVFGGRQMVTKDNLLLQELDSAEYGIIQAVEKANTEIVQKTRDILKQSIIMSDERATYLLLGIENQSELHYALPVKNLIYDALNYGRQVSRISEKHRKDKDLKGAEFLSGFAKEDKLYPVITLTIYFGAEEWDAPRSLKEMFSEDVSEDILGKIDDYHVNLIIPKEIEDFSLFKTDLGKVLKYISISEDKEKMKELQKDDTFLAVDADSVRLINECTNSNIEIPTGAEVVNVCKGLEGFKEDYKAEGRAEGREEGRVEGRAEGKKEGVMFALISLVKKGIITIADAAEEFDLSQEEFEKMISKE